MAFLTSLTLNNFRNYETARLTDLNDGFIVLYGDNGAGKTNTLEAVSLLSPGRGLRGAKLLDLQNQHTQNPWALSCTANTFYGEAKIGTGQDPTTQKRLIRINGETAKSQSQLSEYLSTLWLTPQMDGLFMGGASDRRRFFDRLVATFDPSHQGRLQRYENALRQRTKILTDDTHTPDPAWLSGLEKTISETGVAVSAARLDFIQNLNTVTTDLHKTHATGDFPQGSFTLTGEVETALTDKAALEVEDLFCEKLQMMRNADMHAKAALFGSHKCDVNVTHIENNMIAGQCSTGEQKALLTGIILAHRYMLARAKKHLPILLLDEVAAHFDAKRRSGLFEFLNDLGGQIWMTGTDKNLFDQTPNSAKTHKIQDGRLL